MEKSASLFDRFNRWSRNSITLKLAAVGILVLILLIPSAMISSLITERESLRDQATREVSSMWGGSQTLSGPVISIPYYTTVKNANGITETKTEYAHFLPDRIKITGELRPEKRYRGIYVIVLYNSKLNVSGSFSDLNFGALPVAKEILRFEDAIFTFGISDMKGIRQSIQVSLNGRPYDFNPGIETKDIIASGVSFPLNMKEIRNLNFSFSLDLNGSTDIGFLPFGKETDVQLKSNWGDPSFIGDFLPDKRKVEQEGFSASWHVLQLNRNYPQQGTGNIIGSAVQGWFGVKLLLPVDEYQKITRATKYCAMFIILTFLTFFFVEVLNRRRIHSIQYLLVGFAITLFYILLLSMSEHLSFNLSYLIAALIILFLVTLYGKAIFKSNRLAALLFLILTVQYVFFYSLLQLQDYSLLLGSFGLLFILGIIMFLTRRIDWYAFSTDEEKE